MLKRTLIAALSVAAFCAQATHAETDDSPLRAELQAAIVTQAEDGTEIFEPADAVIPGAIIQYSLNYENVSDGPLTGVVINGKIPHVTEFVAETAQINAPTLFEVRVPDIGWSQPPIMRYEADETGVIQAVVVPPEEYDGLRWRLLEPMAPGTLITAQYRVAVDD